MTGNDHPSFGDLLRRHRTEAGLSQEALAEKAGLSVDAVSLHERGGRQRPHRHTVRRYAEALALSADARARLEGAARAPSGGQRMSAGGESQPAAVNSPRYPLPHDGPFLGREAMVDELLAALPTEPGDSPVRLILLAAEAGMGKTRTLAEVAQRASERGLLVLAGGCYEQEGRLPYAPLHDALLDYLRAQPEAVLRSWPGHLLPELARIVPELRERVRSLPAAQGGEGEELRLRLFWTIARVLDRISRAHPFLLLLDDLQWADDATVHVLHFLLRQPGPHPPLLVGAYRRDEVVAGGALALLLEEPGCETSAGRTVRRIELAPLGEQDLARLFAYHASGPCSPDLVRGLHARCGGNPYFGLQMLALLRQEGRLVDGPDGWQIAPGPPVGLPPAVRETVARRLRNLSPDAQEVLALGAVLGREFDAVVLEAFWERGEHELFDALDRAMAQGVLEETTRGYTFSHPLLREVVYRQLSVRRRERLHARVADTLEGVFGVRADEHAAEIAHHLLEAGSVDRGRIVRYLTLAAGRATDVYAWEEALHLYRAALQQEDDEDRVAPLLEQVASALQSLGRYEEALQALEIVAQQHRRAGDIEQEGAVAAQIAEIHFLRGTVQAGAERIRPILDQLEQTSAGTQAPSRALAALYSALARLTGTTLPLIERAVEVARATGDDRLLATAEVRRAIALIQRGRGEEARQVLEDALPLVEATGDYATLHLALGVLSETLKASGEFESCLAWRERVLHRAEHIGDPLQLVSALAHVGESLFLLGDWAGARQHHERALELGQSITTPWHTAFALLGMAELEVAQGNWEEAARCIATCLTDAERLGHGNWVRNAQRLMGDLEVRRGRTAEGTRRLESLAKEEGKEIPATLFRLAWAYLESGNETEADATIQRAAALARAGHRRFDLCESLIVQGRVYLGQNRVQEVEPVLSEALSLARTMPYPYAEARVLIECARRAGALGDRDQERIHTDLAHGILRRLGARPDLERTEALKMTRQRRDA